MPYTTKELILGNSKLMNQYDAEDANETFIDNAIKKAQARIDVKLRRKYMVPFVDPVPDIIETIATELAAGFLLEIDYSNRREKDEPYLAEVLIKRADDDLQDILNNSLLDGLPGVLYAPAAPVEPAYNARPAIRSTTARRSQMEGVLNRWV